MRSDRGAVLIVTLWVLIILSVLAAGTAFRLSLEHKASVYFLDELKAESLGKSGITWALRRLKEDLDDVDSMYACGVRLGVGETPESIWKHEVEGTGQFNVEYEQDGRIFPGLADEERRININGAGENVLTALFMTAGGVRDVFRARELASYVMDWRDADHATSRQQGAEDGYYESLSRPYSCADRPFRTTEELLWVKDITPELFAKLEPYITVFGDGANPKINFNTASGPVLTTIGVSVGMSESSAKYLSERILEWRRGADKIEGTQDDGAMTAAEIGALELKLRDLAVLMQPQMIPVFKNYFKSNSSYYRIVTSAVVNDRTAPKRTTAIVIKPSGGGRPQFVFYRQE